jgi:opacity protein-like surface antigen
MTQIQSRLSLLLLSALVSIAPASLAQSAPTAAQTLQLSAFGGLSGVYTGLGAAAGDPGGKNLSFTAGVDLALPPHHGIRPIVEVRGTLPIDKGGVIGEKEVLAGGRFDFWLGHRLHPYADFLFGRGQSDFPSGYRFSNGPVKYLYSLTTTNVLSPGGGVDLDLTNHLAVKADFQFQHWGSEPTASGAIYSKPITAGVVYIFDFNHHPKHSY